MDEWRGFIKEHIRIDVTQDDINGGFKGSATYCPVALALKMHPDISEALVGSESIDIVSEDGNHEIMILEIHVDAMVMTRIEDYDNEKGMEPFSFLIYCEDDHYYIEEV